jgi:hypothetical protein
MDNDRRAEARVAQEKPAATTQDSLLLCELSATAADDAVGVAL